ncbi:glycosyltransferase [Fodinicola feengrottensis]|uniref:glycosyltransferase n=1 Tax=Fodinicola feengrottensis TaxID=435914 RepID=UPI002440F06D|nr:nucleotide disphospho-sugar-binding domain-containing protein [Fodinicola feengrottensis]
MLRYVLTDHPGLAADATLGPAPTTPGRQVTQTGAWLLPDDSPLPAELQTFLDAGDPPVYLGFGSMPVTPETSRTLIAAARAAGRRIILSQGWADLGLIDDARDCIAIGDVNQQALFPRVAAVVHHGGAGTTTAAARAGSPQVVVSMFSDQFYWGSRVRALGIGSTLANAELTAQALTTAPPCGTPSHPPSRPRLVRSPARSPRTAPRSPPGDWWKCSPDTARWCRRCGPCAHSGGIRPPLRWPGGGSAVGDSSGHQRPV